jgi:hypothetical protein
MAIQLFQSGRRLTNHPRVARSSQPLYVRNTCFQALILSKICSRGLWGLAGFWICCSTEASVASRSGTTNLRTPRMPRLCLIGLLPLPLCFSCQCKKMRPMPLVKKGSVACASSCDPWTALSQSEAQPEPRTPCAPNSNRCQSGGYHRQLV